jgi:tripartite-type tricarboxylate transporter receptor subunit TctC
LRPIRSFVAAFALMACAAGASAQAYPAKPIRFVIGFPAGSSIDGVSRVVLEDIRNRTGATIVIDNKPGALGALGMETVTRAAPDGYTMMPSSSATNSSGPHLSLALQKLDVLRGLTSVARVVRFDIVVVTSATQKYGSAKALIDAGKAQPNSLTYGYGSGTGQVAGAAFGHAAGIEARGIPYKGQPPAITDLIGGQVDFVAADLGAVLPLVRSASLNAIAIESDKRSTILPAVPTLREVGVPGLQLVGWIGVSGPAHLDATAMKWWSEQLRQTLASADVQQKLRNLGMEPDLLVGDPFAQFVATEYGRWGRFVSEAGIQAE